MTTLARIKGSTVPAALRARGFFKSAVHGLAREMRWSYLPPLMVCFAAGWLAKVFSKTAMHKVSLLIPVVSAAHQAAPHPAGVKMSGEGEVAGHSAEGSLNISDQLRGGVC